MKLKKMIAPVVVTVITSLYLIGWLCMLFFIPETPLWLLLLFGAPALALLGVLIFVLKERIQEIRSGEEDDLGKY